MISGGNVYLREQCEFRRKPIGKKGEIQDRKRKSRREKKVNKSGQRKI